MLAHEIDRRSKKLNKPIWKCSSLSKLAQTNGTAMERTSNELLRLTASCVRLGIPKVEINVFWGLTCIRDRNRQKKREQVSHKVENNYTSGYRSSSSSRILVNTTKQYLAQIIHFSLLFTCGQANSTYLTFEEFLYSPSALSPNGSRYLSALWTFSSKEFQNFTTFWPYT